MIEGVTNYKGITKFYFLAILKQIIKIGDLESRGIQILDFGCGQNKLKEILGPKVTRYDILKELTDIEGWHDVEFDVLVANQVFYTFTRDDLIHLLKDLKVKCPNLELIVGISNQNYFNKLGKYIFNKKDAHKSTLLDPKMEINILLEFCDLIEMKELLSLTKIYRLKFKA